MGLGISNQVCAATELPLTPWRNHFNVGLQCVIGQLKPDLIVSLSGRAVSDGIGIFLARDFDLSFRNHRTSERRAHQIHAFIHGISFYRGPDIVPHKLLPQVFDVELRGTRRLCFFFEAIHLRTLADVGAVTDYLALILLLQPAQHHRCVQAAGVSEDYLLRHLCQIQCQAKATLDTG